MLGKLYYQKGAYWLLNNQSESTVLEVFFAQANIRQGDTMEIVSSPGEVTIRTPQKQAIADNDATILRLIRSIHKNDHEALVGQYLIAHNGVHWTRRGEITDILPQEYPGRAFPGLSYTNGGGSWEISMASFMLPDVQVVVAPSKDDADKIFFDRHAAMKSHS